MTVDVIYNLISEWAAQHTTVETVYKDVYRDTWYTVTCFNVTFPVLVCSDLVADCFYIHNREVSAYVTQKNK